MKRMPRNLGYGFGLVLLCGLFAVVGSEQVSAQIKNTHVSWKLLTPELSGKQGETVYAKVQITMVPQAHLYTSYYDEEAEYGPSPLKVTVGDSPFSLESDIESDTPPVIHYDPNFEATTQYWEGTVTLTIPVKIGAKSSIGKNKGWINFYYMTCDDVSCKPPMDERFNIEFNIKKN